MRRGFTLLEMALVLMILALIAGVFMAARTAVVMDEKKTLTEQRLDAIQEALKEFRRQNMRLPCPANGTRTLAAADFGREVGDPGTCEDAPAGFVDAGNNIATGSLPSKEIGLADEFMYDGWGRKFTYGVDIRATAECSFPDNLIGSAGETDIGLVVEDGSGNPRTESAWYVVVSHGINGHGGFTPSGVRMNANSINANEQINCHCNSAAANGSIAGRTFIEQAYSESSADVRDRFDDIVRFGTRAQIRSAQDEQGGVETCP